MMHPSRELIGSTGDELAGKRIALCLTSSVAAIKAPALARELMRHGADVFVVMSESAKHLVTPGIMYWATGNPVLCNLSGGLEHIRIVQGVDLILIAPATGNMIGMIAQGIADSAITTVAMDAIGKRKPVLIAPAMHEGMMENEAVKNNVEKLKKMGVKFIAPVVSEGKAKMAGIEGMVDYVVKGVTKQALRGKKVLVTAGATREWIDDVRFISNPSSGKMGVAVAREAWLRGAEVVLVSGHVDVKIPLYIGRITTETVGEMADAVKKEAKNADIVVMAAAIGDFTFGKKEGKISSRKNLSIKLKPAGKISSLIRKENRRCRLVLFKAESGVAEMELLKRAKERMKEEKADLIVANDVKKAGSFGSEMNEVFIVDKKGKAVWVKSSKGKIAKKIFDLL